MQFEDVKTRFMQAVLRLRSIRLGTREVLTALIVINVVLLGLVVVLNASVGQERDMRMSAQSLIDRLGGELIVVHDRLDRVQRAYEDSQDKLESTRIEKETLLAEISQRDETIHEMGVELAQLKMKLGHVDLGKVVVKAKRRPQTRKTERIGVERGSEAVSETAKRAETHQGEVLAINKEFNFVIVNLGTENGIKEGMTLVLYQDGKATSDLRVDMVDDTICAAAVLVKTPREIQVGDLIEVPDNS